MLDTLEHTDFEATSLAAAKSATVSVVVPTRNTAGTIAATIEQIRSLAEIGLVDQILVIDANSKDGTAQLARTAGAEVVDENDLFTELGPQLGQGCAGVFDHVVEPCRSYHFLVMGDRGNQARYALQVHLIGLIVVLAALVDALMCARCEGSGTFYQLGHRLILGCCRSRS